MITENFDKIRDILQKIEQDIDKFENNNNKSAGVRVRKSMQEVKTLAQDIRKCILEKKHI